MLDNRAAASVCTFVTAALPLKVPFRIASRSSRTAPTEACVGCAPLGMSLLRSDCNVWRALCTVVVLDDPVELEVVDVEVEVEVDVVLEVDVELVELLALD